MVVSPSGEDIEHVGETVHPVSPAPETAPVVDLSREEEMPTLETVTQAGQLSVSAGVDTASSTGNALGEIGLDYSAKPDKWPLQEKVFRLALPYCVRGKPLILHIRGASGDGCIAAVGRNALNIVREYCGREQLIHLHCFTGDKSVVRCWIEAFPNCYFGFKAGVSVFTSAKIDDLRDVPESRLLLETDSPYFPVPGGPRPNTPAFIGDVALLVAERRGIDLNRLLQLKVENTRRLYGFD
ncbi:uncharacterized metal-dependent hydrolase YcfH-like [Ptychodera flava]|uniref:uncharacterized metal-dependent hydrolase YcfH-like n=1 Tax=Ptychodera flava TaxID=63121 RepID=UPI003969C4B1